MSGEKSVSSELLAAEPWAQIAVAAALVAKMQPNFQLFCELTGREGEQVFSSALALVWEFAMGANSAIDFEKQREKLELVIPDPADFDMYGVWPALDAVVALSALLSCCEQFDTDEIEAIESLSRSTIRGFLEATGEEGDDNHGLYCLQEDYFQALMAVITSGSGRRETVSQLKQLAAAIEASNIGIEVD